MQLKSLCGCEELVFFPVLILRDRNVPIDPEAGLPICKINSSILVQWTQARLTYTL